MVKYLIIINDPYFLYNYAILNYLIFIKNSNKYMQLNK